MKYIFLLIIIMLVLSGCNSENNKYDDLAQCLTEKGMVMYGSIMCGHCNAVKSAFGDSFQYIEYVECSNIPGGDLEKCNEANIKYLPTFIWDGKIESGEITPCDLAKKMGCEEYCYE